jgi:hypothetical protein
MKDNYSALLIAGVILVAISQTLEGTTSPLHSFSMTLRLECPWYVACWD